MRAEDFASGTSEVLNISSNPCWREGYEVFCNGRSQSRRVFMSEWMIARGGWLSEYDSSSDGSSVRKRSSFGRRNLTLAHCGCNDPLSDGPPHRPPHVHGLEVETQSVGWLESVTTSIRYRRWRHQPGFSGPSGTVTIPNYSSFQKYKRWQIAVSSNALIFSCFFSK
jgi:hypothetical protein